MNLSQDHIQYDGQDTHPYLFDFPNMILPHDILHSQDHLC